jgi:hypothetical protein
MVELGYNKREYDFLFVTKYLPMIKRITKDLRYIPPKYIDQATGFDIGYVLWKLKSGKNRVPEEHVETMRILGFERNDLSSQDNKKESRKRPRSTLKLN